MESHFTVYQPIGQLSVLDDDTPASFNTEAGYLLRLRHFLGWAVIVDHQLHEAWKREAVVIPYYVPPRTSGLDRNLLRMSIVDIWMRNWDDPHAPVCGTSFGSLSLHRNRFGPLTEGGISLMREQARQPTIQDTIRQLNVNTIELSDHDTALYLGQARVWNYGRVLQGNSSLYQVAELMEAHEDYTAKKAAP